MSDELFNEYGASIGCVMDARKRYADACEAQGADSWAAQQAQEYLSRQITHRDDLRVRYDASSATGAKR